jgi:hypothetical protein
LLDKGQTVLCHGLDGLTVHGVLGDVLELVEGRSVEEEEGRSGRGMSPETGETGRSTGLQIAAVI